VMGFGGQRPLFIACRHASSLVADATNREAARAVVTEIEVDSSRIEAQGVPADGTLWRRHPAVVVRTHLVELATGAETQATSGEEGCTFKRSTGCQSATLPN